MNRRFSVAAAVLTALALYLPTRSQSLTRVTVDGREIRMLISGAGDLTVVFEGGYGAPLETWGRVQPEVSTFAKTVTYDRGGTGLSDVGPEPRDGRRIAAELRSALKTAGASPPYVIVGHSLGGLYARAFAATYPDEVAGLVLVDPTHDAEALAMKSGQPEIAALPATVAQLRAGARPAGIPATLISAMGPSNIPFMTGQMRASGDTRRAARVADSVANHEWLRGVAGGRLVVTYRNGHNVPQEEPAVVVRAIREMVEGWRAGPEG